MLENDNKSALDKLKKGLYSRTEEVSTGSRHAIHEGQASVPEAWADDKSEADEAPVHMRAMRRTYSYVFLGALFFFVISAIIGGYTLFGGKNFISADNVNIIIEGPASISGGEPVELNVSVVNKNSTDITDVYLIIEYPEGTKDPNDPSHDLSRVKLELGDIKPQSVAQQTISAMMFGEEGMDREVRFRAEYGTANSNATFYKEKSYGVAISSSPVLVTIGGLERISTGQSADFTVTVSSNTTVPVKDLLLVIDYPFGFRVLSSNPEPSYDDNVWRIGDLAPGAKRVITFKATAEGQNDEERTIHANVGIESQSSEREIATTIISRDHSFTIEKPFLGLDLTLNGDRSDAAVAAGDSVRGEIIWVNNSSDKITNARIEAKLSGNVLNKNSVNVEGGYYDSLTNTITWEAGRSAGLLSIAPGETGRVSFSFGSLTSSSGQLPLNPQMTVVVSARGNRESASGVPQDITAGITRNVKIVSNLAISGRALHNQGPISNTGPIPPKAESVTTYTIVWTVSNTSNNITGAKVTAALPPYVSWTDTVSPVGSPITYNSTGGTITWNVGSIPRNTDAGAGTKQVSFQLSLRPSVSQIGTSPQLISSARITGFDAFAGVNLDNNSPALSTRTTSDLQFKDGDDVVQR